MGAYDYYQKPVEPNTLDLIVQRAFTMYELEQDYRRLQQMHQKPLAGLVTHDPQMLKICRMLERLAPTNVNSTLLGESGAGKEGSAWAIRQLSPRRAQLFVANHCSAARET